jgi:hypothetical protein
MRQCRVARPRQLGVTRYSLDAVHCGREPSSRLAALARGPDCGDVDSSPPPSGIRRLQSGSLHRKVLLDLAIVKRKKADFSPAFFGLALSVMRV